jgi:hypothetical protein
MARLVDAQPRFLQQVVRIFSADGLNREGPV